MAFLNPKRGAARQSEVPTYSNDGVPVDGTSGTLAGIAAKGALLSDATNGVLYINTGTLASPVWTGVGTQA